MTHRCGQSPHLTAPAAAGCQRMAVFGSELTRQVDYRGRGLSNGGPPAKDPKDCKDTKDMNQRRRRALSLQPLQSFWSFYGLIFATKHPPRPRSQCRASPSRCPLPRGEGGGTFGGRDPRVPASAALAASARRCHPGLFAGTPQGFVTNDASVHPARGGPPQTSLRRTPGQAARKSPSPDAPPDLGKTRSGGHRRTPSTTFA